MSSHLPLYIEINLALLLMSVLLCLFTWLAGMCVSPFTRNKLKLPPVTLYSGTRFPTWLDQVYTIAFIVYFAWSSGQSHFYSAGAPNDPTNAQYNVVMVLSNLLIYLPMLVRYATLPRWQKPALDIGKSLLYIFGALFTIYLITGTLELSGIFRMLVDKTGAPEMQDVLEILQHGDTNTRICLIISAVIIAPICEECCFRGFLYNVLKRYSGAFAATLATGLVFSAVHTALLQFIPLAVFGWVMCYVYERTRRIWIPIVIHMIFNAVSTAVVLLVGVPV
ncbi:MAG: CPBP family intramembrane metalloprotease [Akkermansia sp.]|nr:CPBP family intramembrane metalloprotease [Akkermansia sp.]